MEMLHGQIFALYLFDVAEAIDLQAAAIGHRQQRRAKFAPKPATPPTSNISSRRCWFDGAAVDVPSIDGFRVGFKLFDYGIISLRLTREFHGTWPELADAPISSSKTKRSSGRPSRRAAASPNG